MGDFTHAYQKVVYAMSGIQSRQSLEWVERKLSKLWNHKLQCRKVVLGKEPVSVPVSLCRDAVKDSDAERNEPWKLETTGGDSSAEMKRTDKSHNLRVHSIHT
ncbi:hypothetical protein E5288_WYG020760 [Bos mutus]|uniref:Uncharacterized protein n=1 Tax=Bos mutus TaxID=72004 RepID=A0A6B0R9Q2_9CETA|nr:hypothetical protein [Bos mutus]